MKNPVQSVIAKLKRLKNPKNRAGMARFGINPKNTLGVSIPVLRKMARELGRDQKLALALWQTQIHEARLLAAFVAEASVFSKRQMNHWVKDFDSWDICDQVCANVFDKTPYAYSQICKWVKDDKEFIRRAGFALLAVMAVHDKKAPDKKLQAFLPIIKKYSTDGRNFVRKSVNWALRQIGKRNRNLRKVALKLAVELKSSDNVTARWIGSDAYRELKVKRL